MQTPGCPTAHFGNNVEFLQHDFATLLIQAFPHLDGATITAFVIGLFDQTMALPQFKVSIAQPPRACVVRMRLTREVVCAWLQVHLRDFVVRMKEFESTDNAGLFSEEEEAKRLAAEQAEKERVAAVPGLLPPNQAILDDGMADEL